MAGLATPYVWLYPYFFGRVGGWCGEIEIKANLSSSQSCELKLELSLAMIRYLERGIWEDQLEEVSELSNIVGDSGQKKTNG